MRTRALVVALVMMGIPNFVAPGAAQGSWGRGPWVPSWDIVYGGYRQVEDIAVGGDRAWGVDYTVVTTPSGRMDQTAFVEAVDGRWRAAQVVDGVGMQSVTMHGRDLGFAVGDDGVIFRYDGRIWRRTVSPTDRELTAVALASPGEAWAVGERATILRWDGSDWLFEESPIGGSRLTAVAATGPGDAWITSLGGQVLHREGGTWSVVEAPPLRQGTDLAFASPDYGMAVGVNVLVYDGAWREVEAPATNHVSVAFWEDTAYVVGDEDVWRQRRGESWEPAPFAGAPEGVAEKPYVKVATAPDGVWAFASDGATVLLRDDTAEYVRPGMDEAWALDMVTPDFGWAGGRAVTDAFVGLGDGALTMTHTAPAGTVVRALDLVSPDSGWAVGSSGGERPEARMWRWDGRTWSEWDIGKTWEIGDLEVVGEDEAWASKGNVIVHWDGRSWEAVSGAPPNASFGGLAVLRDGDGLQGWFGTYGGMYHFHDDTWDPITLTQQSLVVDIEVPHRSEGWAITEDRLYRFDGDAWTEVILPLRSDSILYDVDAPERDNAWILADPDGLYHWDGTNWERHDLSPFGTMFEPTRIRALRLAPASLETDVWVVGLRPSIGRYRVVTPVGTIFLPVGDKRFRR